MTPEISTILWTVVPIVVGIAFLFLLVTRFLVNVGAKEIAIKERRYYGKKMASGRVVATSGEVGIQADVLKPGLHFIMFPI